MSSPVVLAEKCLFKGQIHASASNGNPCVSISNGVALKFIALNDKFVTIQVLHYGTGVQVKNQSWVKSAKVKEEIDETPLELSEEVSEEKLI